MTDFRLTAFGILNAGNLPWSFSMLATGAISEATAASTFNSAMTSLFTTATSGLETMLPTDVSLTKTQAATVDTNLHQVSITSNANVIAGTDANAALPKQLSIVVTTRSATPTKSGHGRFWLPPFAEDTLGTGGLLASTTQTHLQTVFNAFFSSLTTAGLSLFIENRRPLKNGTPVGTRKTLTTYDISNEFRVHRHRVSKIVPTRIGGNI
jgi:hypothetical protein